MARNKSLANNDTIQVKTTAKTTNHLKLRIDDLKTFQPLTDNQRLFFEAYKRGDYFVGLLGSPGVGKTFLALYRAIEEVLDK
jgi:predicted ribonuclease YlaK